MNLDEAHIVIELGKSIIEEIYGIEYEELTLHNQNHIEQQMIADELGLGINSKRRIYGK